MYTEGADGSVRLSVDKDGDMLDVPGVCVCAREYWCCASNSHSVYVERLEVPGSLSHSPSPSLSV